MKSKLAKIGSRTGKFPVSDDAEFEDIETDNMDAQSLQQQHNKQMQHQQQQQQQLSQQLSQQQSPEEPLSAADAVIEMKKQKLYCLQKIAKELEKTNNRLHVIIENQKQESRNHDRMIELLYHISYSK